MGINHESLAMLESLFDWRGLSVLEIGDQCIVPPTEFHMARDWYLSKGVSRYVSIDLNGARGAICRDVRDDLSDLGLFDVVTNFGTLEHVEGGIDGQVKAFTSMSNACRNRGYLIHHVPLIECRGHSPMLYSPQFLGSLYAANGCELIGEPFRVIGGNHTAVFRKRFIREFVFPDEAIRELIHFEGEGISGEFVTN
jgi:hypothetical protein